MVHTSLKEYPEAKKVLDEAEKLDPKVDWIYLARAQLLMAEKSDVKKAEEQLDKAVALNPKRSITYIYRAMGKATDECWKAAVADASKAIEVDPKNRDAYTLRGVLRALGLNELKEGAADLDKALELNPEHSQAKNNRAQLRNLGYNGPSRHTSPTRKRGMTVHPRLRVGLVWLWLRSGQ
jgi:tetratricopeptide (TPR) repeat protein